jgi:hypothetical protein
MSDTERRGGPSVVFTHVPKTAGSTIDSALYHLVGPERIVYSLRDTDDIGDIIKRLPDVDVIAGHVRHPIIHRHASNAIYFAAVRDPIDRLVSNYFFSIRRGELELDLFKDDLRSGFLSFYDNAARKTAKFNRQCQYFSGRGLASDAIKVIERDYALVWNSERTTEAWGLMRGIIAARLGLEDREHVPLVDGYVAPRSAHGGIDGSRPESYRDFLGPAAVEAILHENAEDLKLFEWVQARGGMVRGS